MKFKYKQWQRVKCPKQGKDGCITEVDQRDIDNNPYHVAFEGGILLWLSESSLEPIEEFEPGEEVETMTDSNIWHKRIYIATFDGLYWCRHVNIFHSAGGWKRNHIRKIQKEPDIEITVKIGGKTGCLMDLSVESILKIRSMVE